MKELDELIAAVDAWEAWRTSPEPHMSDSRVTDDDDIAMRILVAAKAFVDIAKRKEFGVSLLTLIEEIEQQLTNKERQYAEAGGDNETRGGNLTCYLPYELLRKVLRRK